MRFLLDTMVISEPARPRPDSRVIAWLKGQQPSDFALSALTFGEIEKGVALMARGKRRDALAEWLTTTLPALFPGRVLSMDMDVAREWGRLSALRQQAGRPLPVIDGLLVASAVIHGLTLVTRNVGDCGGLGAPVLNPWTGQTF